MYAEEFTVYKGFDGLVVEGTGLGQLPNSVVDDYNKRKCKNFESYKRINHKNSSSNGIAMYKRSSKYECLFGRKN